MGETSWAVHADVCVARGHGPSPTGKQHGLYVVDVGDGEHRPVLVTIGLLFVSSISIDWYPFDPPGMTGVTRLTHRTRTLVRSGWGLLTSAETSRRRQRRLPLSPTRDCSLSLVSCAYELRVQDTKSLCVECSAYDWSGVWTPERGGVSGWSEPESRELHTSHYHFQDARRTARHACPAHH